ADLERRAGARRPTAASKELPRRLVAGEEHLLHMRERAIGPARGEAGAHGVGHHRIVAGAVGQAEERPRALLARGEDARVAQRSRVPRDLGLPLAEQLTEL